MSEKPRKKVSYTALGAGAGTAIGITMGVSLFSGVPWGMSISIVLFAGIGGALGIILDWQAKKSSKET